MNLRAKRLPKRALCSRMSTLIQFLLISFASFEMFWKGFGTRIMKAVSTNDVKFLYFKLIILKSILSFIIINEVISFVLSEKLSSGILFKIQILHIILRTKVSCHFKFEYFYLFFKYQLCTYKYGWFLQILSFIKYTFIYFAQKLLLENRNSLLHYISGVTS